jgi:hypothetical protein
MPKFDPKCTYYHFTRITLETGARIVWFAIAPCGTVLPENNAADAKVVP